MPRGTLKAAREVEHLSILGDSEDSSDIERVGTPQMLKKLHRTMLFARRFDERMLKLQRQGRIGTFAPIKGQEAAHIGAIAALDSRDWFVPSFRETGAALWRGASPADILLFNAGFNEGAAIPEGRNDLPIAVPVGTQLLHAVGIAMAARYRDDPEIAMTFFGDGATSQGDFHEALNFAGVFRAPVVFLCQNNHWAISVPRSRQTASETLAQKALAYGLPGMQVDGNDVLAVHAAAVEAVKRARSGEGATMIECVTYRMEVHTTADDPSRYRTDDEVERWRARDPIDRYQTYLIREELLTQSDIESLERTIQEEIESAIGQAEDQIERLGDPLEMFDHIYGDTPPYLDWQRETLAAEIERREVAKDG